MKKLGYVVIIFLLFVNISFLNATSNNFNLFGNDRFRNSFLGYKRYEIFNQISMYSFINNGKSFTTSLYTATLKYRVSSPLTAYLQFGEQYNFSNINIENKGNFLSGITLIYNPKKSFKIGVEYRDMPLMDSSYNFSTDKYIHLWLDKKFGENFHFKVEYYQTGK